MTSFYLRFDMRRPDFSTASHADMFSAALEQCAWAEAQGMDGVHLSEHHGSDDGYCPSPLVFAAAVAARTETLPIFISALIAPLHDPLQLAEDLCVLDHISRGRVLPILSAGYREEEFAAVGKKLSDRKVCMDELVPFLEKAWSGEPFEWQGRPITVTPRPHSQPRPPILMGGSSRPAARRAAEFADMFVPTGPEVFEYYREELAKRGKPDPGPMPAASTSVVFLAEDPDAYWQVIAPHCQHETNTYRRWADKAGVHSPYQHFDDLDALREEGNYEVLTPGAFIELIAAGREVALFHPMCGGISPELAWQSLSLFESEVLPAIAGS
ncbi:MAG: LLM class flavin-dependent oxidoreductase [Pseudomonadota bacterium]